MNTYEKQKFDNLKRLYKFREKELILWVSIIGFIIAVLAIGLNI